MFLANVYSYLYLNYKRREAAAAWFHEDDSVGWKWVGYLMKR